MAYRSLSGESASVEKETVEQWFNDLPEILVGYEPKDIFNIDETGLLYEQMPRKSYVHRDVNSVHGIKLSKKRLTVCLLTNALGEKKAPIIIGKSN